MSAQLDAFEAVSVTPGFDGHEVRRHRVIVRTAPHDAPPLVLSDRTAYYDHFLEQHHLASNAAAACLSRAGKLTMDSKERLAELERYQHHLTRQQDARLAILRGPDR